MLILCVFFSAMQLQDKPGRPDIDSVSAKEVSLHWTAPENISRTRIRNYVIYYGTTDMDVYYFTEHKTRTSATICTISEGIRAKKTYKFAVAAENVHGLGPLSDYSDDVRTPTRDGRHIRITY